jgi:hypothetical protein
MTRIRREETVLVQSVERWSDSCGSSQGHTGLLAIYNLGHCERPLVVALPLSGFENAHHVALSMYRLRENDATGLFATTALVVVQDTVTDSGVSTRRLGRNGLAEGDA